jgi:hypothetical protein
MESQQMMELLLDMKARLDENTKSKQQLLAMMTRMEEDSKALRVKMKAEREAQREERKADVEQILAKMEERMTATQAKTDVKLKSRNDAVRMGASRGP